MTDIQKELIAKYLDSSLFPRGNNSADAKRFLEFSRNAADIELHSDGKYICSYGGILGLGSKVKDVAFFAKDRFYLRRNDDRSAAIVEYDTITRVLYDRGDKYAVVQCNDSKNYVVPRFAGPAVKGIEHIMHSDLSNPSFLSEYLLSVQEKILGEYQTVHIAGLFDGYFPKQSVLSFIIYRCNLVVLNLEQAVFEIKIKDKDFELFDSREWENGVEEFSTRHDILEKICAELSRKLCINYPLEGIQFVSRYKKTLRGMVENSASVVADATAPITDFAYRAGKVGMRDTMIKAADMARRTGDKETAEYYKSTYMSMYEDDE